MKLPKIETLIILVFFACVAMWAISKCSDRRAESSRRTTERAEELEDRPTRPDTARSPAQRSQPVLPKPTLTPAPTPATTPALTTAIPPATAPAPTARPALTPSTTAAAPAKPAQPAYSKLYVTIDGLKMRKQPTLKGDVVAKLELYEEVYFLNQKTEKTEEISLGYEKVTDHWVKIRTKEGKDGWVFGAGVHYYKMKRKGVLE